ncbi:MAG: nicotinate (nicotinamide) nucleotide adenylyltransferase [Eubacterium sp.]|nr:nicotinate (nicotinamide) nucleotide adenylyltransferase [Eubacterium sp.]
MRIGIFGGAFNPVHNGHLNLAKCYLEMLRLDKILFVPTSVPPHKSSDGLISGEHRIKMLRLATAQNKRYEVSDIEFWRTGKSYTFDTIKTLQSVYPSDKFYLITGSDQYLYFENWYRADDILKMVTLVTAARENDEYEKMLEFKNQNENLKNSIISRFDIVEVSSTDIRQRVKNGDTISGLVPPPVEEYIRENNLYV